MRSFRKRLQQVVLAVPLAASGCSAPPTNMCAGAGCADFGTSSSGAGTSGASTTVSRAFGAATTTGGAGPTTAATSSGTTGATGVAGSTGGGTTGWTGPHTCDIQDAGPVCPLCMCVDLYSVVSGPDAGPVASCDCADLCPNPLNIGMEVFYGCTAYDLDGGGAYGIDCYWALDCGSGRRPAGLARPAKRDVSVGGYLAHAAHLEAASVVAFRRVADELTRFEAPRALIRRAQKAACDEVRHARLLGRQARRHGVAVPRVVVAPPRERSLEELARENAIEGCVGETWGAAQAQWQARAALDPTLRRDAARIFTDEAEHARLAWDLSRWAHARLGARARRSVASARRQAVEALRESRPPAKGIATPLGLPTGRARAELLSALARTYWRT